MITTTTTGTRYARCRTLMDLGEQFHADVEAKSALGDLAGVRVAVADYRARRDELTGDPRAPGDGHGRGDPR